MRRLARLYRTEIIITIILIMIVLLLGCGENEPAGACTEIKPTEQVRFADGSVKTCYRLSCSQGCKEWVCRDAWDLQVSCRKLTNQ